MTRVFILMIMLLFIPARLLRLFKIIVFVQMINRNMTRVLSLYFNFGATCFLHSRTLVTNVFNENIMQNG
jgi:hypothetical protein